LADGVHANVFFLTVVVSERAREAFQQRFGIGHFTVIREGALRSDVTQGHNATPFVHGVFFDQSLHQTVERHRTDIEGLVHILVVRVGIRVFLAHIQAHAHAV